MNAEALVASALAQNPTLRARRTTVDAAAAGRDAAGRWPEPMLGWSVAPQTLGNDPLGDRHILSLTAPLPWPGERDLERAVAEHQRNAAEFDWHWEQDLLARDVRLHSYRWSALAQILQLIDAQLAQLQLRADSARQRYASGDAAVQGLLEVQTRLASLRQKQLDMRGQQQQIQARLAAVTRQRLESAVPEPLTEPPPLLQLAQLEAALAESHPRLAMQAAQKAASMAQAQRVGLDIYPDLRANAAYLGTLDPAEKRLQIGLSLSLPLDQFGRRARVRQAEAIAAERRWAEAAEVDRLLGELTAAWHAAAQTDARRRLYADELLPIAEQSRASAAAAWRNGRGTLGELIDTDIAWLNRQIEAVQLHADAWAARAQLRLHGGPTLHLYILGDAP